MKKSVLVVILVLISSCLFAQDFYQYPFFKPGKNDYVQYWDTRNGKDAFFGIEYQDVNQYRIRYYDLKTKQETIIDVSYTETSTEIKTKDVKFIKGKEDIDAYKTVLMDFFLIVNADDKVQRKGFPQDVLYEQTIGSENDKVLQDMTYKYWVPLFNLYSIVENKDAKNSLRLVEFGRPGKEEAKRFYQLTDFPKVVDGPAYSIPENEVKKIKYDMIGFSLDANWKFDKDSAILNRATPRDAFITFDNNTFDPAKIRSTYIGYILAELKMEQIGMPIDVESVEFKESSDSLTASYKVLNTDDNMLSQVTDIFVFDSRGKVDNITVYSYETMYVANKVYFDTIIEQIAKNREDEGKS